MKTKVCGGTTTKVQKPNNLQFRFVCDVLKTIETEELQGRTMFRSVGKHYGGNYILIYYYYYMRRFAVGNAIL